MTAIDSTEFDRYDLQSRFVIRFVAIVGVICILIYAIKKFMDDRSNSKVRLQIVATLVFSAQLLHLLVIILCLSLLQLSISHCRAILSVTNFTFALTKASLYNFFITKLQIAFKASAYQFSNIQLWLFRIFMCGGILILSINTSININNDDSKSKSDPIFGISCALKISDYHFYIYSAYDLITSLFCIYLFAKRLYQCWSLAKSIEPTIACNHNYNYNNSTKSIHSISPKEETMNNNTDNEDNNNNNNSSNSNYSKNRAIVKTSLLDLAKTHTILTIITVISNQIFIIVGFVIWRPISWFAPLDSLITCYCILCMFSFMYTVQKMKYFGCCCWCWNCFPFYYLCWDKNKREIMQNQIILNIRTTKLNPSSSHNTGSHNHTGSNHQSNNNISNHNNNHNHNNNNSKKHHTNNTLKPSISNMNITVKQTSEDNSVNMLSMETTLSI